MRVLVTGGAGLLGSHLVATAPEGMDVEITIRSTPAPPRALAHRIDLTVPGAFAQLVERHRPDAVIHTAYSKDDGAETIGAASEVAEACAGAAISLIHLSTDVVFDGESAPYAETAPLSPVHDYGRSKAAAEEAVVAACPDAAVVRTSLILAADGSDPTSAWVIESLRRGEPVTLFDDEIRMPILAVDLARQLWELAALDPNRRRGVWHLVGPERMSRADLGRFLCDRFGLSWSLVDVASAASLAERRPRDVSLSSVRAGSLTWQARRIGSVEHHG